jgi:hypothetical protein
MFYDSLIRSRSARGSHHLSQFKLIKPPETFLNLIVTSQRHYHRRIASQHVIVIGSSGFTMWLKNRPARRCRAKIETFFITV